MTAAPARLEARGIRKSFPAGEATVEALGGVDLVLGDGEFVSLIGPSGCGKSTLFDILAGLLPPTDGEVRVDGETAVGDALWAGYMPQRDLLFPWRTILDNAILGPEVAGVPRREAREHALALFPLFGLAGFERRFPDDLSGGMRQRAALLRTYLAGRT